MRKAPARVPTTVQLAAAARLGNARNLIDLMERTQPESVPHIVKTLYPKGGLTPEMFDRICDTFDDWSPRQNARV